MAIEITGSTNSPIPIKTPPKSGIDGEKKVAITNPETNDDKVALTTTTLEIKKTVGASSSSPMDIDRVNSIKQALTDGSYSINADKVAQKLIQFDKLMPEGNSTGP